MSKDQKQFSDIKSSNKVVSWASPEFIYQHKNRSWYLTIIVIAMVLMGFFYWQKTYAAMAVIAASVLALFAQARLKPTEIKYTLSSKGLEFKDKIFQFNELKSFWIIQGVNSSKLYINKVGKFSNPIVIELIRVNPESVKLFLQQYLPEDTKQGEHINERVSRFMKF